MENKIECKHDWVYSSHGEVLLVYPSIDVRHKICSKCGERVREEERNMGEVEAMEQQMKYDKLVEKFK